MSTTELISRAAQFNVLYVEELKKVIKLRKIVIKLRKIVKRLKRKLVNTRKIAA